MQQYERKQDVGTLSKSMLIVMVFTMFSKVTGFIREMVLASKYGISLYTDAYKTASDLPCIFLSIIVTALSATLIPIYAKQLEEGKARASRFISNLFTVGIVMSVVVLLLTTLFLRPLVTNFFLPNAGQETQELAIQLSRIMMPMGLFVFLARMSSAYLQANFSFTIPALSQSLLNLVVIAALMVSSGGNITVVAVGTLIGWAFQYAVQIPQMHRLGFKYRPVIDLHDPGLREVALLMLPVLISSAFDQVYFMVDRAVASSVEGNITALDYGNRISTMVSSVLLTTIATVLYPSLVRNTGNREKFTEDLTFGLNLNLLVAMPAMAALILLATPVTRMVYEHGAFSSDDTLLTSGTLACYSAGILGVGLRELCNRCFYAYKNTKIPTIVGVCVVLLNIGLDFALYPTFGAPGIAGATAACSLASGFALLFMLHRSKKVVDQPRVLRCLWKTLVACVAMLASLLVLSFVLHMGTLGGAKFYGAMLVNFVIGIAIYFTVLKILKTKELEVAFGMIKRKLKRQPG